MIKLVQDQKQIRKKRNTYENIHALYEHEKSTLNVFESRVFPLKVSQEKRFKILTTKQILQILPIALA